MPAKMKLSNIDVLGLLKSPEYAQLMDGFSERCYAKKELISTPYNENDSIFIVKSGRLRIYLSYEDREFTLALLEAGDIFSTHVKTYAEAMEDSEILTADIRVFQQMLIQNPDVSISVIKVLGILLKNSINIIEGLAFKDVRQRLYDFLLNAIADRGVSQGGGILLKLQLSMEDIALLIGTSRQTVSTLVNELIKCQAVKKIDRQTLLVVDPEIFKEPSPSFP